MIIALENEHLNVEISTKGAELQRLVTVATKTNYMWRGDANLWAKFSPVLFPIVGALKDDRYSYQNETYTLTRHGFARDLEFEPTIINATQAVFSLQYSAETLKVYPFKFELRIRYQLLGSSLACTYEVFNADSKTMLFSIGGHPAFAVPLNDVGVYKDYYLKFNKDEKLSYHHITGNLIAEETTTLTLTNRELPLQHELFYKDALVFKTLQSDVISLRNTKNSNRLDFHFQDFPYFGIWAAKDANFVCLEPWCGIADGVNHSQQLTEKEGMERLAAGECWQRSWRVGVYEFSKL